MPLRFPQDCGTPRRRVEYCYQTQWLAQNIHNQLGRWFREGLTRQDWGKLPKKIKEKLPYQAKLPEARFRDFQRGQYQDVINKIAESLGEQRELLLKSTNWVISAEDVFD